MYPSINRRRLHIALLAIVTTALVASCASNAPATQSPQPKPQPPASQPGQQSTTQTESNKEAASPSERGAGAPSSAGAESKPEEQSTAGGVASEPRQERTDTSSRPPPAAAEDDGRPTRSSTAPSGHAESGMSEATATKPRQTTEKETMGSAAESANGALPPLKPLTDDESITRLDGELQQEITKFDGMILREQERVRERGQERGADLPADGPAGGEPGGDADEYEATGDQQTAITEPPAPPGGAQEASGGGTQPDLPTQSRDGEYQSKDKVAEIPPDIPDGSDDDVVARQIREAAMRETDPKLRKKLWDEYRKYKKLKEVSE